MLCLNHHLFYHIVFRHLDFYENVNFILRFKHIYMYIFDSKKAIEFKNIILCLIMAL